MSPVFHDKLINYMKKIILSLLFVVFVSQTALAQVNSSYKWTWVSGSPGYNATGIAI
jgi:hypothetical protein